jgi:hypothetical protein
MDLFIFLTGYHSSPFSVAASGGGNENFCGMSDYPCHSFTSITNKTFTTDGSYVINITANSSNTYSHNKLDVSGRSFTYSATSQENTKISVSASADAIFPITTGTLILTSLTLIPSSEQSASIISLSSTGNLTITDCIIKPSAAVTSFSSPLISVSGGTVSITGSTIGGIEKSSEDGCGIVASGFTSFTLSSSILDGCKAKGGNGGGLHLTRSGTNTLSLSNVTAMNCETKSGGLGGGIYLSLNNIGGTLTLSDLKFNDNGVDGVLSKDMYILGSSTCTLPSVALNNKLDFMMNEGVSRGFFIQGSDNSPFTSDVDVYIFLTGFHGKPYYLATGSNTGNVIYCGMTMYKCNTIAYVVSNKNSHSDGVKYLSLSSEPFSEGAVNVGTNKYNIVGTNQVNSKMKPSGTNILRSEERRVGKECSLWC